MTDAGECPVPLAASAVVPPSVVAVLDTILPPRQFRDEAGVAWTQVVSKWAADRLQVDPGLVLIILMLHGTFVIRL